MVDQWASEGGWKQKQKVGVRGTKDPAAAAFMPTGDRSKQNRAGSVDLAESSCQIIKPNIQNYSRKKATLSWTTEYSIRLYWTLLDCTGV